MARLLYRHYVLYVHYGLHPAEVQKIIIDRHLKYNLVSEDAVHSESKGTKLKNKITVNLPWKGFGSGYYFRKTVKMMVKINGFESHTIQAGVIPNFKRTLILGQEYCMDHGVWFDRN